jgi:hypothetical protein
MPKKTAAVTQGSAKPEEAARVEYVRLDDVRRWPRNPKMHNHALLDESFKRWGFVQPLLLDERSGRLTAGHGRLETLQRAKESGAPPPARVRVDGEGNWLVPVLRGIAFKDDAEAEAYLLADNRLAEIGGWDDAALAAVLRDVSNVSMEGVGWSDTEVALLMRTVSETTNGYAPRVQAGDASLDTFLNNQIRQVVIYLPGEKYDETLKRIGEVMTSNALLSHTDVFLHLLEFYENHRSQAP